MTSKKNRYCVCSGEDVGFMIQCDLCMNWFHGECVGVNELDTNPINEHSTQFVCHLCTKLNHCEVIYTLSSTLIRIRNSFPVPKKTINTDLTNTTLSNPLNSSLNKETMCENQNKRDLTLRHTIEKSPLCLCTTSLSSLTIENILESTQQTASEKVAKNNQELVECYRCKGWFHVSCVGWGLHYWDSFYAELFSNTTETHYSDDVNIATTVNPLHTNSENDSSSSSKPNIQVLMCGKCSGQEDFVLLSLEDFSQFYYSTITIPLAPPLQNNNNTTTETQNKFRTTKQAAKRELNGMKKEVEWSYFDNSNSTYTEFLVNREIGSHPYQKSFQHKLSTKNSLFSPLLWRDVLTKNIFDLKDYDTFCGRTSNRIPWAIKSARKLPLFAMGTNAATVSIFSMPNNSSKNASDFGYFNGINVQKFLKNEFYSVHEDICTLDWNMNDEKISTGSWVGGEISLIDCETGKTLDCCYNHNGAVRSVQFSSKGSVLSASLDKTAHIWDTRLKSCESSLFLRGHKLGVIGALFLKNSIDENIVITASDDQTVRLYDLRNPDFCLASILTNFNITCIDQNSNGKRIALNTIGGNILVLDTSQIISFSTTPNRYVQPVSVLKGHTNTIWALGKSYFSPPSYSGVEFICAGSEDGTIFVWNSETAELLLERKTHTHWICDLDWCKQSDLGILSCSEDMTISLLGKQNNPCGSTLSKSSAAFVRWRDGIWYHAKVENGENNLYNVRFSGWYGPDSKGTYDGLCIVADNNNKICACKKGHTSLEVANLASRVQKKEKAPKRAKMSNSPSLSTTTTTTTSSPPPANNNPINYSFRKRVSYSPYSSDFYTPTKNSHSPLTKNNNIHSNNSNNSNSNNTDHTNNNSNDTNSNNNNSVDSNNENSNNENDDTNSNNKHSDSDNNSNHNNNNDTTQYNNNSNNSTPLSQQALSSPLPDLVTPQSTPPIIKLDSTPTQNENKKKENEPEKGKKKKVIRALKL